MRIRCKNGVPHPFTRDEEQKDQQILRYFDDN